MVGRKELVLDCSVALDWVLEDEGSERVHRLMEKFDQDSRLWVPALWWYELANGLRTACAKQRISQAEVSHALNLIQQLPVYVDTMLGGEASQRFGDIAREQNLSAYDAAYLELAQRRGLPLATLDADLARAGERVGVRLALESG